MSDNQLISYYADCHLALEGDSPASLQWFYDALLESDLLWEFRGNSQLPTVNLCSAFFGNDEENTELRRLCSKPLKAELDETAERTLFGKKGEDYSKPLKISQRMAISKAMELPVSFVQGPPGTGKTAVITRLAALAVEKGMTVAIVSSNFSAVKNVAEALDLEAAKGGNNALTRAAQKYALLAMPGYAKTGAMSIQAAPNSKAAQNTSIAGHNEKKYQILLKLADGNRRLISTHLPKNIQ